MDVHYPQRLEEGWFRVLETEHGSSTRTNVLNCEPFLQPPFDLSFIFIFYFFCTHLV
ncbi:hypothetical protein I79_025633 [Cricetulus griseus]|uniref:Uncharacterized protein n=1 Tax=Cricetulus griseus TaxID=10029 RepID=G3INU3_CRIGR|nr:hypothetical protein I79_025633 [Cricetulus griseus]